MARRTAKNSNRDPVSTNAVDSDTNENYDVATHFVTPDCWVNGQAQTVGYSLTPEELYKLVESGDFAEYEKLGRTPGIASKLLCNLSSGLPDITDTTDNKEALRKDLYDTNQPQELPKKTYFQFLINSFNDKMLMILCLTAIAQTCIGIYNLVANNDSTSIYDGLSTLLVVILVTLITSINDYEKQEKFRQLNDHSMTLSKSEVLRSKVIKNINTTDLLVGDILFLSQGMIVPVDGILIESRSLKINESSLTGESKDVRKSISKDPFILGGTSVIEGDGKILVTAVSKNSLHGRIASTLNTVPVKTPLQMKLSLLAELVVKLGIIVVFIFLPLIIIAYFSSRSSPSSISSISQSVISLLLVCFTVLVIVIPEGLPLSVTLALAYAAIYMIKDKCLVRNLASCETMGCSTTICTDKTGTLTMNTMSVTNCLICNTKIDKIDHNTQNILQNPRPDINNPIIPLICAAININSNAKKIVNLDDNSVHYSGSRIESALIEFTELIGYPYDKDRVENHAITFKPFSSANKYSAVVFNTSNSNINALLSFTPWPNLECQDGPVSPLVCVTGAPEIILAACTHYLDYDGNIKKLYSAQSNQFSDVLSSYSSDALRTIAVAIKAGKNDFNEQDYCDKYNYLEKLIFCSLFGVSDPLRPEVPEAIKKCQRAGIVVRMVTGDSLETAKAISKRCGIVKNDNDVILEGKVFRKMDPVQLRIMLPKLRVLARSSPMDKRMLVKLLQDAGEIVSVTGDGTNDTPALKKAHIGFAMGSDSTDMAKRASDIIVLDGNFASVSKAVLWGRSTLNSIKNFLQFQLSVNVSAVLITIITSVITTFRTGKIESVFRVVQLLWINLIMDTLAALSLSTDKPRESLYDRGPARFNESILSSDMRAMILIQAIYQILVCITVYLISLNSVNPALRLFDSEGNTNDRIPTLIFNVFIFCQLFNEINCRSCTRYKNVFKGILINKFFLPIQLVILIMQILIINFGGQVFGVRKGGLDINDWGLSIALGVISLPLGYLVRLVDFDSIKYKFFSKRKKVSDIVLQPQSQGASTDVMSFTDSEKKPLEDLEISPHASRTNYDIKYDINTSSTGALLEEEKHTQQSISSSQTQKPHQEIPITTETGTIIEPTIGPGWQAARRFVLALRVINLMRGGRIRNEENIFRELANNNMLSNFHQAGIQNSNASNNETE